MKPLKFIIGLLMFGLLSGCISTPKRVQFNQQQKPPVSVPGFTGAYIQKSHSEISIYFPEVQYAKFPSKLVLIIKNTGDDILNIDPKRDINIESNIKTTSHFGISAQKILEYFSNSAFGKDCKVDPARTMAGYLPPQNWNVTLKAATVKPGATLTGYLLVDPNQAQLTQLQLDLNVGKDHYHLDLNTI